MSGSAQSPRNNTILCLIAVYGFHGVLVHVISSSSVVVTSINLKPSYVKSIIDKNQTNFDTSTYNESSLAVDTVKNNAIDLIRRTYLMKKNNVIIVLFARESHSSSSEVQQCENVLLKNNEESYKDPSVEVNASLSFKWMKSIQNSTSLSTASGSLSVMISSFSDVSVSKILSPSAWGVLVGCLIFFLTSSTEYDREVSSRSLVNV